MEDAKLRAREMLENIYQDWRDDYDAGADSKFINNSEMRFYGALDLYEATFNERAYWGNRGFRYEPIEEDE